jgi:hypothetical protein
MKILKKLNLLTIKTTSISFDIILVWPQGIYENQSIRGFFEFESSFQNFFFYLFRTSGLSEICKIRNIWKLPSPFLRNTPILCSEKSSWSLKTSFWKKNCTKIQKWPWKFFRCNGFLSFENFCLDVLQPWSSEIYSEVFRRRNLSLTFLNLLDNWTNSKKSFQSLISEYSLRTELEVSRHFLFYKFQTNQRCYKNYKNSFEN